MTKKDYIEKITQNLEHLTKDELKDVSILTTAQYGVRLKVAEKEYIEKEIANLTPKLQQQALPVVPECVADYISELKEKGYGIKFGLRCSTYDAAGEGNEKAIHWKDDNAEDFARTWLNGYTVEKPQLFYLKNKITGMYLSSDGKDLYEHHKNHGFKFTQSEIDSMETGSYELVPVEDGE